MPFTLTTIEDIDLLLKIKPSRDTSIDLREVTRIGPTGVVALLTVLERVEMFSDHPELTIEAPTDQGVSEYLRTVGIFDAMREFIEISAPQPEEWIPERLPATPMIPCTHFTSLEAIEDISSQLAEKFDTQFRGYNSLLQSADMIFSELATNVINHAESEGGYVIAQQYRGTEQTLVEIAIADSGIGIRDSLRRNPNNSYIKKDTEAIKLALKEGVSSMIDSNRGYGLHHVTEDIKINDTRKMAIRSGTGIITLYGDGRIDEDERLPEFPGTIVEVVIPCDDH